MTEDSSSHWPIKRRYVYSETSRRAGLEFVCVFGQDGPVYIFSGGSCDGLEDQADLTSQGPWMRSCSCATGILWPRIDFSKSDPRALAPDRWRRAVSGGARKAPAATCYISPSARCASVNGLAGCYVSTIGKSHEYFDLTTKNVVNALPNMTKQVVLLVYDDELPPELARTELKTKLRGEWRLERRSARHTELVRRKD